MMRAGTDRSSPGQLARVAGADQRFVVRAGVFGHPPEVLGQRQLFQHHDGLDDVLVDLEALFVGQRAAAMDRL
jgi:hypothetical protein